ncbi:MAG: hypothetical protein J6X69_00225 [Bacteroidales bacterium]|nr:hypothetical protein [Bacteroidales bacterium]
MKKAIVFFAFLFLLMILCMVTCPDRNAHQSAIVAKWSQVEDGENGWQKLGSAIGSGFISLALDARLDVQDCIVLSLGQIDGDKIVSVGIFKHVFVVSREKIDEALK